MSIEVALADICKDLRLLGEVELTKKAITAYAALTDSNNPRPDLSYSYIMRILRKEGKDGRRLKFQKAYKAAFDAALYADVEDPAAVALMVAVKVIDFKDDEKGKDA